MNEENLIPLNRRTPAERERIARLGGIKSGESRRAWAALKKYFYEQIKIDSYVEDYIISHAMKKRYCGNYVGKIQRFYKGKIARFWQGMRPRGDGCKFPEVITPVTDRGLKREKTQN